MSEKKDQVRFDTVLDSGGYGTVRRRDGRVEVGTFREMREGQPIPEGSELVQVDYRPSEEWHDSKTIYKHSSGPAQVATPAYRAGYDRIFGKKEVGLA